MGFKKVVFSIAIIGFISINVISAGLFGYDNGECDLFRIDCPEGYHNAGELTYDDSLFLSTAFREGQYHAFRVESIGISQDNFTNFEEEELSVDDTLNGDDFEAYKTTKLNDIKSTTANSTFMFYHDGEYDYELKMWHDGCPYDEAQFKKDVELLKDVAHSIKRNS